MLAGGAGYGDPAERPRAALDRDVGDGRISAPADADAKAA